MDDEDEDDKNEDDDHEDDKAIRDFVFANATVTVVKNYHGKGVKQARSRETLSMARSRAVAGNGEDFVHGTEPWVPY